MDNDDKNFTLHNCERALKKKRTDKWWFLKMHLKRERERRKKVHREWSWIDTLKNKQLSVGHGYLKVEAKMDPIIIYNSFEISISPSSAADLPRSRPTNDSSSNCMTGERGGGPPFFAPATIKTRRRPRSLIIRATLVFHASKVQIPRHVSRVAWKRASGQMPLPPVFLSFFFFFFSLLSARPNSSRRKKEKKKKKRND